MNRAAHVFNPERAAEIFRDLALVELAREISDAADYAAAEEIRYFTIDVQEFLLDHPLDPDVSDWRDAWVFPRVPFLTT